MKHYESEITKFLKELKKQNPAIEAKQLAARQDFWDKPYQADKHVVRNFLENQTTGLGKAKWKY